jgi:hypothetical protein
MLAEGASGSRLLRATGREPIRRRGRRWSVRAMEVLGHDGDGCSLAQFRVTPEQPEQAIDQG